jgi:hypothetical protein
MYQWNDMRIGSGHRNQVGHAAATAKAARRPCFRSTGASGAVERILRIGQWTEEEGFAVVIHHCPAGKTSFVPFFLQGLRVYEYSLNP